MNIFERLFSSLAIIFAMGLIISLVYFPELRQLHRLIPICLLGLVVNMVLMFIVLRDIATRQFHDQRKKYFWMALVLIFWPSILIYLPRYGFRPRVM